MIYQFPNDKSRLHKWAITYTDIWSKEGWLPASKFIGDYVPEQLWPQVTQLVQQEMLRRGIHVEL